MSKDHQPSQQESWGRDRQGFWEKAPEEGYSFLQGLFCCPQTLPALSLPPGKEDCQCGPGDAGPCLPHLLRTLPSSSFWLCGRGMAMPMSPGMTTALLLPLGTGR